MDCQSIIPVAELISNSIHTREAANLLIEAIEKDFCNYIELDFSSVDYISRSFADQFHVDKLNCANKHSKTIIVLNANDSVRSMLQAVARTQKKIDREFTPIPVYKYSSTADFENFMLAI